MMKRRKKKKKVVKEMCHLTMEGSLTNVKILKGCHPLLDAEAVRIIETTAGKWSCGHMSGTDEPVDVAITYPIGFQM